jgi:hypothetical protein
MTTKVHPGRTADQGYLNTRKILIHPDTQMFAKAKSNNPAALDVVARDGDFWPLSALVGGHGRRENTLHQKWCRGKRDERENLRIGDDLFDG